MYKTAPGPIDRSDLPLDILPVRGRVYLVRDYNYWQTNSVVYRDPAGILFVDSTWSVKTARQLLWWAATQEIVDFTGIVVTSFPLYHTGGLEAFRNEAVPIFAGPDTSILLDQYWKSMQDGMASSFGTWEASRAIYPDRTIRNESRFLNGRVRVIFPGEGHTPDNLVVYFPEEKILYAGSLVSDPPVFMQYAQRANYRAIFDRLKKLDFDTVIAGHGEPLRKRDVLDRILSGL